MTQNIERIPAGRARATRVTAILDTVDRLIDERPLDRAYSLLKHLSTLIGPNDEVNRRLARIHRTMVPRWHFPMLNDRARNEALARAIRETTNLCDKTVLDIGAGTGLLSMLAARHGAAHVYACEMVAPVADKAREIIADNDYADRVTLIPKVSYDVRVGVDMPRRADVLLSETIDCGFVGEGFLGALRHARSELLMPDAILMPRAFSLHGALLESDAVYRLNKVDDYVDGFRLGGFNELSTQSYFPVRLDSWPYRLLSDPHVLVAEDLATYSFAPVDRTIELRASATGQVHGIVFWFEAELVQGVSLSNAPGGSPSHWMQAFACFERPIAVAENDSVVIHFRFCEHAAEVSFLHTNTGQLPRYAA